MIFTNNRHSWQSKQTVPIVGENRSKSKLVISTFSFNFCRNKRDYSHLLTHPPLLAHPRWRSSSMWPMRHYVCVAIGRGGFFCSSLTHMRRRTHNSPIVVDFTIDSRSLYSRFTPYCLQLGKSAQSQCICAAYKHDGTLHRPLAAFIYDSIRAAPQRKLPPARS
jgi:hypothetical protein